MSRSPQIVRDPKHFYIKEIYEQPEALRQIFKYEYAKIERAANELASSSFNRLYFIASGGAFATSFAGKQAFEELLSLPVHLEPSSEFEYYNYSAGDGDLIITLSQSGETIHTLKAVRLAKKRGAKVWAVTNNIKSTLARQADYVILTHAGEEKASSTKTSITRIAALYLLAIQTALRLKPQKSKELEGLMDQLMRTPTIIKNMLPTCEETLSPVMADYKNGRFFSIVGCGPNICTALYGAVEFVEHQIPAYGLGGGEFRHGPITLMGKDTPVILVVHPKSPTHERMVRLAHDLREIGAPLMVVDHPADEIFTHVADFFVPIEVDIAEMLSPLIYVIPLQLMVYYLSLARGVHPDEFRHMTKVTKID